MNSVAHNLLTPATCPHITGPDTVRTYKMYQETVASNAVNTNKPRKFAKNVISHTQFPPCVARSLGKPGEIGHGFAAVSPRTIGA